MLLTDTPPPTGSLLFSNFSFRRRKVKHQTSEFRPGLIQTLNAGTPRPVPLALQAQSRPGKVFQEADVRKKEACVKGTEGPV